MTVEQIATLIEEDDDILNADIYIEPPENALISDGDSDDEDAAGDINKLGGNQLRAGAVCSFRKLTDHGIERVRTDEETHDVIIEESDDDIIPPSPNPSTSKKQFFCFGRSKPCCKNLAFKDTTIYVPTDVPMFDVPTNVSTVVPTDVPINVSTDVSINAPNTDIPPDVSVDAPIDGNFDVPIDDLINVSADISIDLLTNDLLTNIPLVDHIDVPIDFSTSNKLVANKKCRKRKQTPIQKIAKKDTVNKKIKVTQAKKLDKKTARGGKLPKKKKGTRAVKAKKVRNWKREDILDNSSIEFTRPNFLQQDFSPVEAFEYFFDDEVCDYIVECTNEFAVEKGNLSFTITRDELRIFFAILFLSGYNVMSRTRMYWELSEDVHNNAVANAMSRNRFEDVMRYLHFCKNAELKNDDRFGKIRPIMCMLNERWLQYFPGDAYLSIDESMVPYYGRHGAKQHIHGKPIRFGYKVWILATRLGYVVQGEPYQGKGSTPIISALGQGGSVVIDLLSELPQGRRYSLFFDNFFTSFRLLEALKRQGHDGTGTVRADRVEDAPLPNAKSMKKEPRGTYHQLTDADTGITLVRYHDNNVFTMASTSAGVAPTGKAKRWSRAQKKHIMLDQPASIILYNTYMGGVDRMDENIASYRINIRNKKWYWPMVSYLLSVSMNNGWLLYRMNPKGRQEYMDFLGFTRYVVRAYLAKYKVSRPSAGRPSTKVSSRVLAEVRYSQRGHFLITVEKQVRCAQCGKATRKKCKVCQVGIHTNCNEEFHSR